jgi:transposase
VDYAGRRPWLLFEAHSDWKVMLVCAPREALRTSCCRHAVQERSSSSHGLGKPAALSTFVSSTRPAPVREDTTVCFSAARGRLRYPFQRSNPQNSRSSNRACGSLNSASSRIAVACVTERADRYRMGDRGALIPPARHGGRKRSVSVREALNGIFYIRWTGCQWRALPKDLPPKSTVHDYLELWNWEAHWSTSTTRSTWRFASRRDVKQVRRALIHTETAKGAQKGGLGSVRARVPCPRL